MKKAYLVLEDGRAFEGFKFGADVESVGELVFTTGMGGYLETLTDPSLYGQIAIQTFPLIGNYGVIEEDFEGECALRGYVIRELCETPSNFRSQYGLEEFLRARGIAGLCGIDTRQLTRIIRERGVMNAAICDRIPADTSQIKNYRITGGVESVSCDSEQLYVAPDEKHRVSMIDYGAKRGILRSLLARGCSVRVMPASSSAEEILAGNPDGLMLSNGPGDPTDNVYQIEQLKLLLGRVPMFGICLGHQLLALAAGGKTVKMKYGHRGENQPVRDLTSGRTYISSQNHGYTVDRDSITRGRVSFENANDLTCEGIEYPSDRSFGVQFHPEGCAGPRDTEFLFDRFVDLMKSAAGGEGGR